MGLSQAQLNMLGEVLALAAVLIFVKNILKIRYAFKSQKHNRLQATRQKIRQAQKPDVSQMKLLKNREKRAKGKDRYQFYLKMKEQLAADPSLDSRSAGYSNSDPRFSKTSKAGKAI